MENKIKRLEQKNKKIYSMLYRYHPHYIKNILPRILSKFLDYYKSDINRWNNRISKNDLHEEFELWSPIKNIVPF